MDKELNRHKLLLAGILLHDKAGLSPHHRGSIQAKLGYPTEEELNTMIMTGKVPDKALRQVTEEDFNSFCYFYEKHGDLDSFSGWDELKPAFQQKYPEVIAAIDYAEQTREIADRLVENMEWQV